MNDSGAEVIVILENFASVLEQVRAAAAVVRGGSLDLPPPHV